ncbi:MAG: hypothetical protein ABR881_19660 [Candidatus Sulfotelmatobacter sp.]|jgi:hypothetical protein
MMTDPAFAIKNQVQQLVDVQIDTLRKPASLTSSELDEYRSRSERISALYDQEPEHVLGQSIEGDEFPLPQAVFAKSLFPRIKKEDRVGAEASFEPQQHTVLRSTPAPHTLHKRLAFSGTPKLQRSTSEAVATAIKER